MTEPRNEDIVSKSDVELLLRVVRERFLNLDAAQSNAIVLAIEGLRWLVGEESAVTRASLAQEDAHWQQHSIMVSER